MPFLASSFGNVVLLSSFNSSDSLGSTLLALSVSNEYNLSLVIAADICLKYLLGGSDVLFSPRMVGDGLSLFWPGVWNCLVETDSLDEPVQKV